MTSVAVMQPTFMPWLGYFDLMDQVDHFVLLDTVAYSHQSWQQRNRIRSGDGLAWLTVPVQHRGRSGQTITSVALAPDSGFPDKQLRRLRQEYGRAPWFEWLFPDLEWVMRAGASTGTLCGVTVPIIDLLRERLGVDDTRLHRASALPASGRRSALLASLCSSLGAATYVTPPGSLAYLVDEVDEFRSAGVEVVVHDYEHPVYPQLADPFVPFASAVDLLFIEGPDAPGRMRSGRRPPFPLEVLQP